MTLTESQNKMIAEALGLCWHEWVLPEGCHAGEPAKKCKYCGQFVALYYISNLQEHYPQLVNHPFDTWDGFRLIVENGPKQNWWNEFVCLNPYVFIIFYNMVDPTQFGGWAITQDYIGPKLGIALTEWLERREKK